MTESLEIITEIAGDLQAEILRGLLEAQGVTVFLSQESAAKAIGITIPALGTVQILVPSSQAAQARQVLQAYHSGQLANTRLEDQPGEDEPSDLDETSGAQG